jgi:hypothetical protein
MRSELQKYLRVDAIDRRLEEMSRRIALKGDIERAHKLATLIGRAEHRYPPPDVASPFVSCG